MEQGSKRGTEISEVRGQASYRIEGFVKIHDTPLEGITVQLIQNGEIIQESTTFSDGWYQFTGLSSGQTFTVCPLSACRYSFTPSQEIVEIKSSDVTGVNFNARRLFYSIYGKVSTEDSEALKGFQISLWQNESLLQTTITDSNGNYAFYNLDNGSYTVIPESRCNFTPQINSVVVYCGDYELNFTCSQRVGEKNEKPLDNTGKENDNKSVEDKGNMAHNIQNSRKEALEPTYYFYTWDHLGTTRVVADINGSIVSIHNFEPYGVEIPPYNETASNTHKYTGHERDASTGYDYMHFRYYASSIGRYMKPDNITGSPMNPQNWNLYSYVRGNPVNFNDPTGHQGEKSAQLPQSGGDPNATQEAKEQIKEEQSGNKDEEAKQKKENPPDTAKDTLLGVATMGMEIVDLSMGLIGMENPVSESLKEQVYGKVEEKTGAFEGKENLRAAKEILGSGLSLLRTTSFVKESTIATQEEMALNARIVAAGGEASALTGGFMQTGLTIGTVAGLAVVTGINSYALGSQINERVLPEETKNIIGDTILGSLQSIGIFRSLEGY